MPEEQKAIQIANDFISNLYPVETLGNPTVTADMSGEENNRTIVIFEEATKETHISDIMYKRVMETDYSLISDNSEINTIKLSANGGSIVVPLTDGKSYASVVDSDISALAYYYKNKLYRVTMDTQEKISSEEIGDVSRTGDTRYSIISENGSLPSLIPINSRSNNSFSSL